MTGQIIDLSERPRRRSLFVWSIAVWAGIILIEASIMRMQSRVPLRHGLSTAIIDYIPLGIMSLFVWRFARWVASRRMHEGVRIAAHVVFGLFVLALWKGIYAALLYLWVGPHFFRLAFTSSWMYQVVQGAFAYGTMIGIMLAIQAAERERQRERREAELQIAARDAELTAIKAQLHPHFILNSLNSILALVATDPQRAREMIIGLGELLQATFSRIDYDEVPLEHEIELARRYLDIEQIRFADRLQVSVNCDAGARDVAVPPLILQPLVENAVKHGGSSVSLSARQDNGRVVIEVHDSGKGASEEQLLHGGRGLELTRRRLNGVYGDDYALTFEQENGFTVRLELPSHA